MVGSSGHFSGRYPLDETCRSECGFTVYFSWSSLEPEEGVYTFEWLDEVMDSMYKNGIYVILATPSAGKPPWLIKKYPDIIKEVDNLSRKIIEMSLDTQKQIDEYILARQKIITYKYSNKRKIEEAQKIEKQKAEDEIRKMIGNQILSFERVLLKQKEEYSKIMYYNETENLVYNIFNCVYFSVRQEEKYIKNFEIRYKKQLSKQARKDLAINKSNSSKFHWEEEK